MTSKDDTDSNVPGPKAALASPIAGFDAFDQALAQALGDSADEKLNTLPPVRPLSTASHEERLPAARARATWLPLVKWSLLGITLCAGSITGMRFFAMREFAIGMDEAYRQEAIQIQGHRANTPLQIPAPVTQSADIALPINPPDSDLEVAHQPVEKIETKTRTIKSKLSASATAERIAEPSVEMAQLSINTSPWAYVFIDDKRIQSTPLVAYRLPSGDHDIRLENAELGLVRRVHVNLAPGEDKRLRIPLMENQ